MNNQKGWRVFRRWLCSRMWSALLLFSSCTGVEPVIQEMKWRIVYHDDNSSRFEEIHIGLRVSDGDGDKDLSRVIVSSENEDLEWKIDSNQWITESTGSGEWTSLPPILPMDGQMFSSEVLTLTLEDLAGESARTSFRPSPSRPRLYELTWPTARMENNILELRDNPGPSSIILRDAAGEAIQVMDAFNGMDVDLDRVSSWEIWIPLPDISSAFRLGPYSVFLGR